MIFIPDLNVMLAYTAAAVILVITPGPDMALFLGQTLTGGRTRGIAAYLGASAGLVVHTMLAAFGLGIAQSVATKFVGASPGWAGIPEARLPARM